VPSTYEKIEARTLGSNAVTVTFTAIPGTYTDLILVANMRGSAATFNNMGFPLLQFNTDTGNNYSYTSLFARNTGGGNSAVSERSSNTDGIKTLANISNIFSPNIIQIQNYSNTTTYKTALVRGSGENGTTAVDGVLAEVGLWRNTAAITSVQLNLAAVSQTIQTGSTFTLYGIKAA
jgi:hypothetical protein